MFISDELAQDYSARAVLLTFPWVGIIMGTWGFFWEVILLFAVFIVGRSKGVFTAALFLVIGYIVSLIVFGVTALNYLGFVPLAGLLGVFGWQKNWPVRVTFFWSAALAGILGAVPTLAFVVQGFDANTASILIDKTIQQYQASGLLEVMQQQGINEVQVRDLLHQGIQIYALVIPSIIAIISIIEFGFVFYIMRRWFKGKVEWIPFTHWRLPWYAVWGAVLGIASYLLGDQFSWPVIRGLGINLMVVYGALTLVLGVSAYLYLLQSPRIPRFLKWALILVNFIYFMFSFVSIIMFGLFDLVMNFRRLPEES
ncbi:MAG: putative rane protein [Firmicutes bacterium]|nr:putative rane protein [Bacillota bacterium]